MTSSSHASHVSAASREVPHISSEGWSLPQTAGRSGRPNSMHRPSGASWTHGTPAGFPFGMPGMGEEMDGAMQHAAQ